MPLSSRLAIGLVCVASCAHRAPVVVPATPAQRPVSTVVFRDAFDAPGAVPGHALNHALEQRQSGPLAPATWSRAPGVWFTGQGPDIGHSSVIGPPGGGDGRLVFHTNTAVRLERAIAPDAGGGYEVRFRVDPVVDNVESLGWVSVLLSTDPDGLGWVTRPDAAPGLLVRSNGDAQLFHRGEERAIAWEDGRPAAAHSYDVTLRVWLDEEGQRTRLRLRGTINRARFDATLEEGAAAVLPPRVWLTFGAHYHPDWPARESWIDDVRVGGGVISTRPDTSQARINGRSVRLASCV